MQVIQEQCEIELEGWSKNINSGQCGWAVELKEGEFRTQQWLMCYFQLKFRSGILGIKQVVLVAERLWVQTLFLLIFLKSKLIPNISIRLVKAAENESLDLTCYFTNRG